MTRFVAFLKERLKVQTVVSETPAAFVEDLQQLVKVNRGAACSRWGRALHGLKVQSVVSETPAAYVSDLQQLVKGG